MRLFAFLLAIFASVVPAQAGFVFTIGTVSGQAGSTFTVPVTVTTSDNMQFGAAGNFNLGIDVSPAGTGLPSGITFNTTPLSGSALFANPVLNTGFNGPFSIDGIVNSGSPQGGVLTNNVASTVFNLRFDVAGSVGQGFYAINFVPSLPTADVIDSNGNTLSLGAANGYSLSGGGINISAVPEPSSFTLLGLVVVCATGYAGRRRFRKNQFAV